MGKYVLTKTSFTNKTKCKEETVILKLQLHPLDTFEDSIDYQKPRFVPIGS